MNKLKEVCRASYCWIGLRSSKTLKLCNITMRRLKIVFARHWVTDCQSLSITIFTVLPISEGLSTMVTPAFLSALILEDAVPLLPEVIAPRVSLKLTPWGNKGGYVNSLEYPKIQDRML